MLKQVLYACALSSLFTLTAFAHEETQENAPVTPKKEEVQEAKLVVADGEEQEQNQELACNEENDEEQENQELACRLCGENCGGKHLSVTSDDQDTESDVSQVKAVKEEVKAA